MKSMLLILLSCSVSAVVSALLCILIGPKLIRRYSKPLSLIAVGFLITLAVTHIIPEAMEESDPHKIGMVILFSMLFLTFVEMFFFSGNKGKVDCCGHSHLLANGSFGILFGSSLHNFCDGMVIASAYLTNPALGFAVTVAVLSHEIAHELGDYAIMLDLGMSNKRAIS